MRKDEVEPLPFAKIGIVFGKLDESRQDDDYGKTGQHSNSDRRRRQHGRRNKGFNVDDGANVRAEVTYRGWNERMSAWCGSFQLLLLV